MIEAVVAWYLLVSAAWMVKAFTMRRQFTSRRRFRLAFLWCLIWPVGLVINGR